MPEPFSSASTMSNGHSKLKYIEQIPIQVFQPSKSHQLSIRRPYVSNQRRTDEMRPQWFKLDGNQNHDDLPPIPYDKLWESDHLWLPLLLEKRHFIARTDFIRQG